MSQRIRLAVVVSHPIQYHAPMYRLLARSNVVDPEVLFLSAHGLQASFDPGFGRDVAYDIPLVDGYRHRFIPNRSRRPDVERPFGLVNPGVARALQPRQFDAVLVHGYAHVSEWLSFVTAHFRRLPYLLRGESRLDIEAAVGRGRRVAKRAAVGSIVRHAAACLAIGAKNRDFYISYGASRDRVFRAPYSVDNDRFAEAGRRGRERRGERLRSLGLDPRSPVVLFAAKLQPKKRPLDLVGAVDKLHQACSVIFVGDGPLRPLLADLAASRRNIRVVGFLNQREIGEWYGMSDVFVLPSEIEPWGLAVNEAMAAGTIPIVSDAVGCAADLVTADTGRVVATGDTGALAHALDELLASGDLRSVLRRRGQERIGQFGLSATVRGIEEGAVVAVGGKLSRT